MLTEEQKTHFHALGFVRIEGALTSAEVDEFSSRFDTIVERGEAQGDGSEPGGRIFPDGHRVIIPLIEADPYFYTMLDHPNLASIAEELLGEDCIFTGSSDGQIHTGDTAWHRDGSMPLPALEAKLTFYLDDAAAGEGCLSFIPGSHLWPLHYNDLERGIDERVLGYPIRDIPGRYDVPSEKGDVIAFQTRIWHSSWGGGANRRQMAWMMRTAPRMQWELDRLGEFNKSYAETWSPATGRLISDRLWETADARRLKKVQLLKDLGL
jgi:hypothetical protein